MELMGTVAVTISGLIVIAALGFYTGTIPQIIERTGHQISFGPTMFGGIVIGSILISMIVLKLL
jgi:hypothetical protein